MQLLSEVERVAGLWEMVLLLQSHRPGEFCFLMIDSWSFVHLFPGLGQFEVILVLHRRFAHVSS